MPKLSRSSRAGVERLESRILLNAPPEKFVVPLAGKEGVDWAVTAYPDRDRRTGIASDYGGRQYTYDGSQETHFSVADFAAMDRGVDVLAAAGGTVVDSHDGEYDRNGSVDAPVQPKIPDNYVLIDHGDGWRTRYGRLRLGSVAVSPGQVVEAGQKIGQVGGSGESSPWDYFENNTFLRFQVAHGDEAVDPFLDAPSFWQEAPAFAGDSVGVWYMTTNTARPPNTELWEHLPRRQVFHPGEPVSVDTPMHGLNAGRLHANRYFAPDGTQVAYDSGRAPADRPTTWRHSQITLPVDAQAGEWQVALEVDGEELARTGFIVADRSEGRAEIKVYQGGTYVIDGRTTPVDFGRTNQGAGAARRSFSIQNFGTRPLEISQVAVPAGFSVVGTPPASVPAGSSRTLTVQLDTRAAGAKAGQVVVRSNDAEEGEFNFAITGTVAPVPAAVVGRYVFYRGSSFDAGDGAGDDAAIAPDKQALLPGQGASFVNVTSYTRGLNGIIMDVARLPVGAGLTAADFALATAGGAAPAPASVSVRRGAGAGGSDRVTLAWPDGAIKNTWLRVSALATAATGLAVPDVFSFGNVIGDTGDSDAAPFRVNALDLAAVRQALNVTADLTGRFDFNRDGRVNALDLAAVRSNVNGTLAGVPVPVPAPETAGPAARRVWDEGQSDVLTRARGG